jgi:hypothetical protein
MNKEIEDILMELAQGIGKSVTDSYVYKHGIWEGISIEIRKMMDKSKDDLNSLIESAKQEVLEEAKDKVFEAIADVVYESDAIIAAEEAFDNLLESLKGE